jgi:glucan phosphoethanolaminetransferase (alkaline phosphatase superfamily)
LRQLTSSSPTAARPNSAAHIGGGAHWLLPWAGVTAAAAVTATLFDAVLLHYRRAYFTGGFLARDFVTSPVEAVAFVGGSFFTDAAVAGVIVWAALWLFGRLAVRRHLALAAAFILALLPIFTADFVEYQLITYLGDAFDLRLLFELSGWSTGEVLAVSSAHLSRVAWIVAGAAILAILVLWLAARRIRIPLEALGRVPAWPSLLLVIAVFFSGATVMTLLRSGSDVLDNGLRRKPTGRLLGSVVEAATDLDRDGYGMLGRPDDPSLFDERVRPYALDVPGNGVDEDGVGGDLPADVTPYTEGAPFVAWRSKPDVVLIVLESFRADVRGAHLGGKPVTPVLDSLAAKGIAPVHAYSHNGYTVQSRRHIFSGSVADIRRDNTLIDDFKRQGYEVAYFSGQDESFGGPQQGVGFDRADVAYDARTDRERRYSEFTTAGSLAVPYGVVQERVAAFLDGRRNDRPLFLYVNFHDTHFPYHHRAIQPLLEAPIVSQSNIAPGRAGELREMYMNTASNVDHSIGEVVAHARLALGREPGVIVLSDHGESLFDEGFLGHGYSLNDAQTRIPLVVSNLPIAIEEPFAQADLRDAIAAALARNPDTERKPTLTTSPSRTVFQYLGMITRPAQIALTGLDGRIAYDFREGRARVGGDEWQRPEDLNAEQRSAFLNLIQTWERMMLARNAVASTD